MTSRCGDEEELLRLLDGELTENEAERLRQHLRACGVCAARSAELARTLGDLKAPLAEVDPDAAIEEVMRRLPTAVADASAVAARPRVARWSLLAGGLAAVLAMSALVVTRRVPRGQDGDGFQARGTSAGTSIGRAVGVGLYRAAREHEALAQETRVRPDDAYGVRYRNLLAEPVYLLAFAIDATGTVHWVSPSIPRSEEQSGGRGALSFQGGGPPAVRDELEAPSPGPMRFVAIVSRSPLHVLDVDGLRGADLETDLTSSPVARRGRPRPGDGERRFFPLEVFMKRLLFLVFSLSLLASLRSSDARAGAAKPARTVFALIVTSNHGVSGTTPDLHYADDDGVKYLELFRMLAPEANVVLHTELDRDTERLYPWARAVARPPTRAAVSASIADSRVAGRGRDPRGRGGGFVLRLRRPRRRRCRGRLSRAPGRAVHVAGPRGNAPRDRSHALPRHPR